MSALLAFVLAAIVTLTAVYVRRRGSMRSKGALIAVAVLVLLLVIYGATGGLAS